jgi:hypothetical protein
MRSIQKTTFCGFIALLKKVLDFGGQLAWPIIQFYSMAGLFCGAGRGVAGCVINTTTVQY